MSKANKLINEKSPYLLQHAYNPVNWFPWSDEAFQKAKKEDKPIFLSIGYSTCHWCHVMEKESFEDEEVAALMNDAFISIKVDREERPDIDGVYMSVCQLVTGSGGWPLTVIMTPDKKPFFTGTYFPKANRYGRIGMMDLIPRIKDVWIKKREDVLNSADEITQAINKTQLIDDQSKLDNSIFEKAYKSFLHRFDEKYGGFGTAPKFPSPHNLIFLLRYYNSTGENKALEIVEKTLIEMRKGGIYDHIGFGFARYSTDQQWLVPHFEKMLYDQAMLIMAYTETFLITKNEIFKQTAKEIIEYVLRDMTNEEGGFYSAEDADSEGEEGKFYLWDEDELGKILSKEECEFVTEVFNVETAGNWIDESKGMMPGTNILHLKKSYTELSDEFNISETDLKEKIEIVRKKLFDFRERRIHPHKDDKILTDWNALMIAALCKAGQAFDDQDYIAAAEKSYRFIEKYLTKQDGALLHRFRDGQSGLQAHIDDYAFLINASIELYETTFKLKYLERALQLNDILFNNFLDGKNGGFFFTSEDGEELIARQKEIYDGAIPSGNSIQMLNLLRLARLTGKSELEEIANQMIQTFSGTVNKSPSIFSQFLTGLYFIFEKSFEIVFASNNDEYNLKQAVKSLISEYLPNKVMITINQQNQEQMKKIAPFLANMQLVNNKTLIYVCEDFTCNLPVTSIEQMFKLLNRKNG